MEGRSNGQALSKDEMLRIQNIASKILRQEILVNLAERDSFTIMILRLRKKIRRGGVMVPGTLIRSWQ